VSGAPDPDFFLLRAVWPRIYLLPSPLSLPHYRAMTFQTGFLGRVGLPLEVRLTGVNPGVLQLKLALGAGD
jgi:hypothetical protein